jgi:predicted enzyme related to lactoylglutathione lyase
VGNPVVFFEVFAKSSDTVKKFYKELFGWQITTDPNLNYGYVETGGGKGIPGGIGQTRDGQPTMLTFYVEVPDIDKALESANKLGAKTVMPKTVIPNAATIGLFADPEGNVVGLVLPR